MWCRPRRGVREPGHRTSGPDARAHGHRPPGEGGRPAACGPPPSPRVAATSTSTSSAHRRMVACCSSRSRRSTPSPGPRSCWPTPTSSPATARGLVSYGTDAARRLPAHRPVRAGDRTIVRRGRHAGDLVHWAGARPVDGPTGRRRSSDGEVATVGDGRAADLLAGSTSWLGARDEAPGSRGRGLTPTGVGRCPRHTVRNRARERPHRPPHASPCSAARDLRRARGAAAATWCGPATTLVVDLGSGTLANLQQHLDLADVDAVVLSHEHPDHWLDLPVPAQRHALRPRHSPTSRVRHGRHGARRRPPRARWRPPCAGPRSTARPGGGRRPAPALRPHRPPGRDPGGAAPRPGGRCCTRPTPGRPGTRGRSATASTSCSVRGVAAGGRGGGSSTCRPGRPGGTPAPPGPAGWCSPTSRRASTPRPAMAGLRRRVEPAARRWRCPEPVRDPRPGRGLRCGR